MSETGHNGQLKAIIERIENVNGEIAELAEGRSDIFKEAKSNGYDIPALRAIIRARSEDPDKRKAREAMIELYRDEMGLI
jgi:uncharacterized protein (UPF0335 family)